MTLIRANDSSKLIQLLYIIYGQPYCPIQNQVKGNWTHLLANGEMSYNIQEHHNNENNL